MNKFSTTVIAGFVAQALSGYANAAALSEVEDNHPLAQAQYLTVNSQEQILLNGVVGTLNGPANQDLDFFEFYAQQGDVVTLDIDGGIGGQQDIDTVIAVYNENGEVERLNDDADTDPGSSSTSDSRIDDFLVPATGRYTVAVSNFPRFFTTGGDVLYAQYDASGDYVLNISGVSVADAGPSVTYINIEVKPGRDGGDAPINPRSRGKIPVALLSSQAFNAMTVDTSRLYFGAAGTESSLHKCNRDGEDVNNDGLLDLVCHFNTQATGFDGNSLEGVVTGYTVGTEGETAFEGRGPLKIVPSKTK
jgi:hypothetical protein